MKKLWKCNVCGFIYEGAEAPEKCPKCGVAKENFVELSEADAKKVYDSDRTNDIHMEIIDLCGKIAALAEEGIQLNLDPACVKAFDMAQNEVWTIKQRSKAELAGHMSKGKW